MSVQKGESGKRWIQVEVEVSGTPEEVWKAIATGPGISSWFMPIGTHEEGTEPRVGGAIYMGSGDEKQKIGEYTKWDPPRGFAAEGKSWGPDAPTVAHEWTVEARAGGTCLVRVVNSCFADTADWDNQLEDLESGWPRFFRILKLYMKHFPGQPCSAIHLMGPTTMTQPKVWETIVNALGLAGAKEGGSWKSSISDVTQLSGTVEDFTESPAPSSVLRIDEPVPGIVSPLAFAPTGSPVMIALGIYLYGDTAADFVDREQPKWQKWMMDNFPMN
jgi:uncharacterized protein YndB with AHSA1/START domain